MKNFKLVLIVLLFSNLAIGQDSERFTKFYYPNPNYNAESYGLEETSYGYIIAGIHIDTLNNSGNWVFDLKGVNFEGDELWSKKIGYPNLNVLNGWHNSKYIRKFDSYYYSVFDVLTASSGPYTTSTFSVFTKLNEFGDSLWTRKYYGDAVDSVIEIKDFTHTIDKGFILTGKTYSFSNNENKTLLIKTDSLGNIQWRRKINLINGYEEAAVILQDSASKKYIILDHRDGQNRGIITDSLGNIVNQITVNSPFINQLYCLKQLSDGNFVASGAIGTGNTFGSWDLSKSFLVKFDILGNVIWQKKYGTESILNSFSRIAVLSNDTIMVAGEIDTLYTDGLGLNSMYQLYKIAPNGDSLWSRSIDITINNFNQDVFKDVIPTIDGGFAMTGFFNSVPAPNPFVLVKLDRYGCSIENCQLAQILETPKEEYEFSVYPNPATDLLTLDFKDLTELPDYYEILDFTGKVIFKENVKTSNFTLSIRSFSSSLYLLKIFKNGEIMGTKTVSVVR